MACRSCLALPCTDLGKAFSTLAVLCTQQRCCRAFGQTSCSACQKPMAPSPVASSGSSFSPFSSRRRSKSSRQLRALSRKPSSTASSSLRPLASAPIRTSRHCRSWSVTSSAGHRGEVDAVGPEVDVAAGGEIALLPAFVLFPPALGQPPHGRGREARRLGPEQ